MELVNINAYAMGYRSGSTYNEDIMITKESYEKIKTEDLAICIGELDGKHSECKAYITIDEYNEEQLLKMDLNNSNDGEVLYWILLDIFANYDMNLDEEIKKVNEYVETLDTYVSFNVTVKKSQRDKVLNFVKTL